MTNIGKMHNMHCTMCIAYTSTNCTMVSMSQFKIKKKKNNDNQFLEQKKITIYLFLC